MSRLRWWRRHDEIPVSELGRTNPVRFATVLLIALAIALYFGFTKHIPFKHGYRLNAVFSTAVNIKSKSPITVPHRSAGSFLLATNWVTRTADPSKSDTASDAASRSAG